MATYKVTDGDEMVELLNGHTYDEFADAVCCDIYPKIEGWFENLFDHIVNGGTFLIECYEGQVKVDGIICDYTVDLEYYEDNTLYTFNINLGIDTIGGSWWVSTEDYEDKDIERELEYWMDEVKETDEYIDACYDPYEKQDR